MPSVRGRLARMLMRLVGFKRNKRRLPTGRLRRRMERFMSAGLPLKIRTESVSADGVAAEWVIPADASGESNDAPVLFYLHGGGYIAGSVKSHRRFVKRLSQMLGARGFHIDYRRAPEHPFPAAVEDCFIAYRWLLNNGISPASLIVGGESAGGAFVITTLLQARDQGLPMLAAGFCFSPHVDFDYRSESITSRAESELFLTQDDLQWGRNIYAGNMICVRRCCRRFMRSCGDCRRC